MLRLLPLLFAFFATIPSGNASIPRPAELVILNESGKAKDFSFVRSVGESAIIAYEKAYGRLPPITIQIVYGARSCLRVGYDFERKVVQLCAGKNTIDYGTESIDVLRHELFHAMLCGQRPDLCTAEALKPVEAIALHEGLADFFAYSLSPDAYFGESFYQDQPSVRAYQTSLCYSLVNGAHEKGNAVASNLIDRKIRPRKLGRSLPRVSQAFRFETLLHNLKREIPVCFRDTSDAPAVEAKPLNYPVSKLNRFKIERGRPLELLFEPNPALLAKYPDLHIRWVAPREDPSPNFRITSDSASPRLYRVEALGSAIEKTAAEFYSGSTLIGRRWFYFTDAPEPAPN